MLMVLLLTHFAISAMFTSLLLVHSGNVLCIFDLEENMPTVCDDAIE